LLNCTRIKNAHKARKKRFPFCYVNVIGTTNWDTEQIRACVSRYDLPIIVEAQNDAHMASTGVRLH